MKSTAVKPQSVRLTAEEIDELKRIADALGITEHAARHFAIKRLIADWKRGWRPKTRKKTVKELLP